MSHNRDPHNRVRRVHVPGTVPDERTAPPLPKQAEENPAVSTRPQTVSTAQSFVPDPAQMKRMRESLRRKAEELLLRSQSLKTVQGEMRVNEVQSVTSALQEAFQKSEESKRLTEVRIKESFSEIRENTLQILRSRVDALSPEILGAVPEEMRASSESHIYSPFVRVGTVEIQGRKSPALIPWLGKRNLWITGDAARARELVLTLLARAAGALPVKHLKFLVFDPRLSGCLAALSPLRNINGETFPTAFTDSEAFSSALETVIEVAARNVERITVRGVSDIIQLWETNSIPEGELTVAVVLGFPYAVGERLRKVIQRALAIGPASGLSMIILDELNETDNALDLLRQPALTRLNYGNNGWECSEFFGSSICIQHDGSVNSAVLERMYTDIKNRCSAETGPTYPLDELLSSSLNCPWSKSSVESLDAVIGKTGQQELTVSFRSANPPTPNLLVGGAVGQGKSNLLLDIIFSLCLDYSPDELELLLLDFKKGLEFKRFDQAEDGTGWMPHVRVLSLESNQEFGVAVMRYVNEELERRSRLFKSIGVNSISEYRASGNAMPRTLLIIDEFHAQFEGEGAIVDEAVQLLETLARQGRAYGIHILLASQTTSGIQALNIKGDSIYSQFALRMSLKNTSRESQVILSQHNTAASDLTYRGEVIFNANFGQDPLRSNIRGVAAWVDGDKFSEIQRNLWAKGHKAPPMVFIGSDFASWGSIRPECLQSRSDGIVEIWLGRPIAVTEKPYTIDLDSDTNQGIAIVGTGDELAEHALGSIVTSALAGMAERAELVILCGLNVLPPSLARLFEFLRSNGRSVEIIQRRDIPSFLVNELAPKLNSYEGNPKLIVGLGVQRIPGMDSSVESVDPSDLLSFDFIPDSLSTGNEVLQRVVQQGALYGIHFVGWWSSRQGIEETLGFQQRGIRYYIFLKAGLDDIRSVAGPLVNPSRDYPRLSVYDLGSDEGLRTVVPFEFIHEMLGGEQ